VLDFRKYRTALRILRKFMLLHFSTQKEKKERRKRATIAQASGYALL
jgi:hypothetical protein